MNILDQANKIINERSEEKVRQYGPFIECNRKAATIASVMCNKEITTQDIYNFQIALKLARESFSHKEDNLLDAVAYIGALNNFHEEVEPEGLKSSYSGRENKKWLIKIKADAALESALLWWDIMVMTGNATALAKKYFPESYDDISEDDKFFMYCQECNINLE